MTIDLFAAPASDSQPVSGWAVVASLALAWVAGYAFACWVWPFAKCRKCKGAGRLYSPSGKAFRKCPRCKFTGRRIRAGRRVFNFFHLLRKDAE